MSKLTEAQALERGFTEAIIGESIHHTLDLPVRPDADLDGCFLAFDRAEGEWLSVRGGNFAFEQDAA